MINAEILNAEEIAKKLDESLYAEAWGDAFRELTDWINAKAHKRAPKDTGRLESSLTMRMDTKPVPLWAKISTDAMSEGGVRYPFVLEAGYRAPAGQGRAATGRRKALGEESRIALHKRGTKRSTRKWLRGSLGGARRKFLTLLFAAVMKIEAKWRS
jgi:hypothetical protein